MPLHTPLPLKQPVLSDDISRAPPHLDHDDRAPLVHSKVGQGWQQDTPPVINSSQELGVTAAQHHAAVLLKEPCWEPTKLPL